MKTTQQLTDKLETLVTAFEALVETGEKAADGSLTGKAEAQASFLLGGIMLMAWVLGCEDTLAPLLQHARLAGVAEKAKTALGDEQ